MPIKSVYVKFDKLMGETLRAYLLRFHNEEMWFPKRFCWQFTTNQKLGGNMVIPTWLYKEKFNQEPQADHAETIVEHHIPDPVKPVTPRPNASLTR